jgi:glycosyltransferase involved in cell wall biosynthesis
MERPYFSILMPARNAEATLPQLLDSILRQRHTDWELVAVDDGSDDGSLHLLTTRAKHDRRIRVFPCRGEGLVEALNTGLSVARGRWTVRVDADDICHPELLAALHGNIRREPEASVHAVQVRYVPRQRLQQGLLAYESWINSLTRHEQIVRDMFVECPMPHPTLTCRRDNLISLGGYRDMGWPEDYDLVLRFWLSGSVFSKAPVVRYFWRDTAKRLSRTHGRYSLERFMRAKIAFLLRSYLSKKREAVVGGAGPVGKAFARMLTEEGVKVKAFLEVNPAKIGKRIYGIDVVAVREATAFRGTMILQAVGQKGTREGARELYHDLGLMELEDFLFVS